MLEKMVLEGWFITQFTQNLGLLLVYLYIKEIYRNIDNKNKNVKNKSGRWL